MVKCIFLIFLFLVPDSIAKTLERHYSFSLTGNVKYQKKFSSFDYVNPKATKGGSVAIGVVGNFDSVNDNILLGSAADGLNLLYDSLFAKSLDEISTAYMLLAEYYQISKSTNEIIFKIRDNSYWSDGTPLTSEDVLFSYKTLKSKGHPFYKIAFKDVIDARLQPGNKISFKLKNIGNKDLIMKIGSIPILSKEYYEANEFNKITLVPPLTSGPYLIKELKSGKYIIYKRNKKYWGKNINVNTGRYNFDEIKYVYYRDANIAIQALKAKEYDIRLENIAKNWAKLYTPDLLGEGKLLKKWIDHKIPTGMQCFVINNRIGKFSDLRVRKALSLAFDFEWTNKNLFYSAYSRTNSFFSNSPYEAKGNLTEFEKRFLADNIAEDQQFDKYNELFSLPVTDATGDNRKNLINARDLLREAGWKIKDFVLVNNAGERFQIEFLVTSSSFQRVILPYIKNLKKLGIDAKIRMVDFSQYQKQIENFDFEITVTVFPGVNIPGNEQFTFWHSKYANLPGSNNIAGIENYLIDKILLELIENEGFDAKVRYSKLLDRVLRNNFYVIPHWNISAFRMIYWDKLLFPSNAPPYGLSFDSWWMKENIL